MLGLDLRGGAHLLLEVDRESLVADRVETLEGDIRQTLRDERIGYRGLAARGQTVSFTLREPADAAARAGRRCSRSPRRSSRASSARARSARSSSTESNGRITATLTDEGIEARMRSAVTQSVQVLDRRAERARHDRAVDPGGGQRAHPRAGAGPRRTRRS